MKAYKEFQFGWIIFLFALPIQLLISYLLVAKSETQTLLPPGIVISNLIFIAIYVLFYGMHTIVDDQHVKVSFGIGLFGTRVSLQNIKSLSTVDNPWYYGWGIRLIPNGMLYNISGLRAVELSFHTTKSILRIGTKEPALLTKAILERIGKSN